MQKNVLINSFNKGVRNFFLTELVSKPIVFKKFTPNEGKYFLDLLEIFFYYDLNKLSLTIPQVEILYKKIFSYLYSGDFGDGTDIKLYEKPNKKSKNAISKLNVNQIRENHKILKDLYSFYTRELKSLKLPSGKKISKIIVFEAPPYREKNNETSHFIFSGGTYYRAIVGEEIIKKKDKKSPENKYNHIYFDSFLNSYSGWKVTQANSQQNLSNIKDDALERIDKMINSEIVYIDLFLLPIFMDSIIRKRWATEKEYFFKDKSLIVHLLDWALQDFRVRIGEIENKIFSDNCLIAFGMPLNTSIAIFEHYTSEYFILEGKNKTDISRLNSPTAFKKMNMKGITFPMFKSNVIGGNNLPDFELVKNAFNL